MEIQGTVALVTGAAIGTGRALARRLHDAGASVALADIDADGGTETEASLERSRFRQTDLRDPREVEAMIEFVVAEFGRGPDILVNNAGGGPSLQPAFPDAEPDRWNALLDVNLRAPMLATQLVARSMDEAVVVNMSSTAGLGYGVHDSPEYSVAKAGLIRFTATLAPLRERGIRVNCVVPDWIATERALDEYAAMPPGEPPPIPMEVLTDAVVDLITDDSHAGTVLHIPRTGPPRILG